MAATLRAVNRACQHDAREGIGAGAVGVGDERQVEWQLHERGREEQQQHAVADTRPVDDAGERYQQRHTADHRRHGGGSKQTPWLDDEPRDAFERRRRAPVACTAAMASASVMMA